MIKNTRSLGFLCPNCQKEQPSKNCYRILSAVDFVKCRTCKKEIIFHIVTSNFAPVYYSKLCFFNQGGWGKQDNPNKDSPIKQLIRMKYMQFCSFFQIVLALLLTVGFIIFYTVSYDYQSIKDMPGFQNSSLQNYLSFPQLHQQLSIDYKHFNLTTYQFIPRQENYTWYICQNDSEAVINKLNVSIQGSFVYANNYAGPVSILCLLDTRIVAENGSAVDCQTIQYNQDWTYINIVAPTETKLTFPEFNYTECHQEQLENGNTQQYCTCSEITYPGQNLHTLVGYPNSFEILAQQPENVSLLWVPNYILSILPLILAITFSSLLGISLFLLLFTTGDKCECQWIYFPMKKSEAQIFRQILNSEKVFKECVQPKNEGEVAIEGCVNMFEEMLKKLQYEIDQIENKIRLKEGERILRVERIKQRCRTCCRKQKAAHNSYTDYIQSGQGQNYTVEGMVNGGQ